MARYPRADANLLAMALVGYEAEKQRLEAAIADLKARLDHWQPVAQGESAPKKRTMSAAGRRRIAAAQRARWAAVKRAGRKRLSLSLEKKLRDHPLVAARLKHKRDMFAARAAFKECVTGEPAPDYWHVTATYKQIKGVFNQLVKR